MDKLCKELICCINDYIPIIDKIHFSQINKFNYQSIKINKDNLPHLLISRFNDSFGIYGNGYKLSMFIKLDQLKSYFDRLEKELELLKLNPPKGYKVSDWSEIFIIVLINNKPINERNTHDAWIFIDMRLHKKINYDKNINFRTLIRNLINIYEIKNSTQDLPIIQNYGNY